MKNAETVMVGAARPCASSCIGVADFSVFGAYAEKMET